ncbi:hemerythrin domain-containing protein [Rhodococcus jostii]|uniref:hemerythrin domain-containing protein n=1 Tax=Rhodococcus jostii TaxID=132919 RepID=UPI003668D50D
MSTDRTAPVDTRMMGIVHDALRRDLDRTRTALTASIPPANSQRVALADHLMWMMEFLRLHHRTEDDTLWPLIRRLKPDAAPLLDRMDADHASISPGIDRLRAAAEAYRTDGSAHTRDAVITALDGLEAPLLPHLRREEDEMMPVVARTITIGQWDDWGHDIMKDRPKLELAREVPWILDGLDDDRYREVTGALPAVPRFLLLHALAGRYRRASATRWGGKVEVTPRRSRRHERRPA